MTTLGLSVLDTIIFVAYFILILWYGYWVYKKKKNEDAKGFFLAEGSLTWWAIGASIVASNISAEQFIGMSGQAFQLGIAISVYELFGAIALLVVAVYILPMYLKNQIYTMPQFLSERYDGRLALVMAFFWLFLYIFVNLTSIIYLGGLSISSMTGLSQFECSLYLVLFGILITLGGMRVIGYTDAIQVVCLVLGGLATTYISLQLISTHLGTGAGIWEGMSLIKAKAESHLHLIFEPNTFFVVDGKGGEIDAYSQLPGIMMFILGGQLVNNLNYFGCNQYITQRALGADLSTARNGILFAAFLKIAMPFMVVLPGLAAYVLFKEGAFEAINSGMTTDGIIKPDNAYPVLLNLLPVGIKGVAFAALTAAIVSSLAGKANSISTIYMLDIHKKYFNPTLSEQKTVWYGRIAIFLAFTISLTFSPLLADFGQVYEYIQVYTGYISPGILSIFLLGFFWKKATANGALVAVILSLILSMLISSFFPEIPFLNRMGMVFWLCSGAHILVSMFSKTAANNTIELNTSWFKLETTFKWGSAVLIFLFTLIYIVFW